VTWRQTGGRLDVLLVSGRHGWSWPVGVPRDGENSPRCATRVAAEATGIDVTLGRPLPGLPGRSPDGGTDVALWAAIPACAHALPAGTGTVGDARWLPVDQAARLLHHRAEAAALDMLRYYAASGQLDTHTLIVLRHAKAMRRAEWRGAEADRPLAPHGRRQARELRDLLGCWRPRELLTSPWRRCTETVDSYARAAGCPVRLDPRLSETGFADQPKAIVRRVRTLLASGDGVLVCTHRPVLAGLIPALARRAGAGVAEQILSGDPWLIPGEFLVGHARADGGKPRLVAVERHLPMVGSR
jgi:8-oxo-dGTP diphosphatase